MSKPVYKSKPKQCCMGWYVYNRIMVYNGIGNDFSRKLNPLIQYESLTFDYIKF